MTCRSIPAAALVAFASALLASVAAAKEDAFDAGQLFASTCGFCHEKGGRVAGKGPKLAGTTRSDAFIINRIKNGKEGAMPAFEGNLTNRQIKAIVVYIRHLKEDTP